MRRYHPEPLTLGGFKPFGQVDTYEGKVGQHLVNAAFERSAGAGHPILSVVTLESAASFPLILRRLERHPHSAQTFLALTGARCLVVACENSQDGSPDLETLRSFIISPAQIITYRRGVWHHSVTVLQAPSTFAMVMAQTGRGDDTEFFDLVTPMEITVPHRDGSTAKVPTSSRQ
jgi:ureidoglycolate lyase